MAVIKGNAKQTTSVSRVGEGVETYMRMLRDGTVGVADLIALWSLEGRIFTIDGGGQGTTPITFGAGTLDVLEHDLHVSVPASVCIIPLKLIIHFDAYGTIGIVECCMQYGSGSTVGTATACTPRSSNANTGLQSACTVKVAAATGVNLTTINEVWHDGAPLGVTVASATQIREKVHFEYNAMDTGILHVIGPSQQLVAYASGGSAGAGFINFSWAELPVTSVE